MTESADATRTGTSSGAGVPGTVLGEVHADPPPFSPEQLAWIDRLIVSRQDQRLGERGGAGAQTTAP